MSKNKLKCRGRHLIPGRSAVNGSTTTRKRGIVTAQLELPGRARGELIHSRSICLRFPSGGGSQPDSRRHHVALLVTRLSLFPSSLHPYSEWRPENGSMRGELKLQSADYNSAASSLQSSRGPRSGWMLEINMRGVSLRCSLARPTPGHSGLLPGPQTTACNWGLTWINKW